MSSCSGSFTHCQKSEVTLSASCRLWLLYPLFQFHIWLFLLVSFIYPLMLIVYMIKLLPNRAEAVLVAAIRL